MTAEVDRPALELLGALLREHGLGRPGPARERALEAAKADTSNAHVHLLDATCAAVVAGEPRAAARLLAECETSAPGEDEAWQRRFAACRSWIWTLDRLWYPGDTGAEIASAGEQPPDVALGRPGDQETLELEALATVQFQLLNTRWRVESEVRQSPEEAVANLHAQAANAGTEPEPPPARLFYADLLHRAGAVDEANSVMADARAQLEGLARDDIGAAAILARSFLLEGDWYATPGSSPEALGFDLWKFGAGASPFLAWRDLPRAADAYSQAEGRLSGVDAPRLRAALAMRRGTVAWLAGDFTAQKAFLRTAADEFSVAGDSAGHWLTVVHDLLADVGLRRIAAIRLSAGTSFDLEAHGPIAALCRWGEQDGSASWTTGLGRILQRAGADWDSQGDYPRAELAYEMAVPLVPSSGAEAPATAVLALAGLDRRYGLVVRGLTRSRAAVATLPPVADASREVWKWAQNLSSLGDVLWSLVDGRGTAAGMQVAGLDWAVARTQELLALPGAPATSGGLAGRAKRWLAVARRLRAPLQAALVSQMPDIAELYRGTAIFAQACASFERGREAADAGALRTAEEWYDDALARLATVPQFALFEVNFLAGRGRIDEAQKRLRELLDASDENEEMTAMAALRVHDYSTALRLFGSEPDLSRPWNDLANHAEAALGAGQAELAVTLTNHAVHGFEERLARIQRDADRVAACDDERVTNLYHLAARAQLESGSGPEDAPERRARAFELSDRARTLAVGALLADASHDTQDERLTLAWRQATSEWETANDRLCRAYVSAAGDDEIGDRISHLASAERQLVEVEAELEESHSGVRPVTGRPATSALQDVQDALPRNAALVEYQLVGSDLLIWTVTQTTASAHTSSHKTGTISRLAKAVQRSCSNGDPGPEADELAEILLGPLTSVADACERLIIVPYGRLHGLPFHVLPHQGHALGETHVVSYVTAAAQLRGATVDAPLHGQRALVVGDPAFDPAVHPSLRRLPGAEVEASAVAETNRVRPLIGADAAEETIRRDLARCDLVHLAAHGRLDPIAPSDSSIVLAGRDELTVSDLVGLRIDSQLVVLSACDSGRGSASLGGDVVGLARGLLAAGVRRSVVSLWPVDDAPACATMSLFHQHLAEGAPTSMALHSAQQAIRAMSGAEIAGRYAELGGDAGETASTRRRGAPSTGESSSMPLDPEFVDDLADAEPIDELNGGLARVWAPFVASGV
jgi:CHAT domain-containing protein